MPKTNFARKWTSLFLFFLPWFSLLGYLFLILSLVGRLKKMNFFKVFNPSFSLFDFALFFLIVTVTISVIFSVDRFLSLGAFFLFLFYLLALWVVRNSAREGLGEILVDAILLAALVVTGFGIVQYLFNLNLNLNFSFFRLKISTRGGLSSTLGNPNRLAKYLVLVLPFVLSTYSRKKGFFKVILIILFAMGIFCLGLTYSLGGIGAFGVTFLVFLMKKRWKWGILVLAVGGFLFMIKFDFLLSVIETYSSLENRLYTWENVIWPIFSERSLFGTGLATYRVVFSRFSGNSLIVTSHAHNLYLNYLVELGIFGLGGLLFVFIVFFLNFCKTESSSDKNKALLEGCFLAILGALVHASVETYIDYFQLGLLFWSIIGLGTGIVEQEKMTKKNYL